MILAAGFGERMRPLTEHTPKPLLKVGGKSLIEYHLERLSSVGVRDVIINVAHLGDQIKKVLGSGERWQLSIQYSVEPEPLETAGAIVHALPLLGESPFLLVNGDVWTDFPFTSLLSKELDNALGHLVLVNNPEHHPGGDFSIDHGLLANKNEQAYTFAGVSLLHPSLLADYPESRIRFPLGEVFRYFLSQKKLTAEHYSGQWFDIGTVDRLESLDHLLSSPC
ncbi:MAG: N-acetylmuramate alpha-1-phosphate uridylyltransferase MurU [Cellvibrionaceae bacterium]